MKNLLEQLLHTCNELNDENEIAIINKYGCNGKNYTVGLTGKKIFFDLYVRLIFFLICKSYQNSAFEKLENRIRQIIIIFLRNNQ